MRRVQIKLATDVSFYTFPINPIEFENQDSQEVNFERTIDGYSIELKSTFDGRPRVMTWQNLPNSTAYLNFVSQLRTYIGQNCVINLLDLLGTESSSEEQNIRVVDVQTKWTVGPASANSKLKYEYIKLVYVLR